MNQSVLKQAPMQVVLSESQKERSGAIELRVGVGRRYF